MNSQSLRLPGIKTLLDLSAELSSKLNRMLTYCHCNFVEKILYFKHSLHLRTFLHLGVSYFFVNFIIFLFFC
jgi:hypothetical protein